MSWADMHCKQYTRKKTTLNLVITGLFRSVWGNILIYPLLCCIHHRKNHPHSKWLFTLSKKLNCLRWNISVVCISDLFWNVKVYTSLHSDINLYAILKHSDFFLYKSHELSVVLCRQHLVPYWYLYNWWNIWVFCW